MRSFIYVLNLIAIDQIIGKFETHHISQETSSNPNHAFEINDLKNKISKLNNELESAKMEHEREKQKIMADHKMLEHGLIQKYSQKDTDMYSNLFMMMKKFFNGQSSEFSTFDGLKPSLTYDPGIGKVKNLIEIDSKSKNDQNPWEDSYESEWIEQANTYCQVLNMLNKEPNLIPEAQLPPLQPSIVQQQSIEIQALKYDLFSLVICVTFNG